MPEGLPVAVRVGAVGDVSVDVLERGLDLIQQIAQFDIRRSGQQDVVGSEAMGLGEFPGLVRTLTVAAPTEARRPSLSPGDGEGGSAPSASSAVWFRHRYETTRP